jgi:hypothetical protein
MRAHYPSWDITQSLEETIRQIVEIACTPATSDRFWSNSSPPRSLPVADRLVNCAGGSQSAMSLRQLSQWCEKRFGPHAVASDPRPRPFDIPWMVLDSAKADRIWGWRPQTPTTAILEEIAGTRSKIRAGSIFRPPCKRTCRPPPPPCQIPPCQLP